MLRLIVGATKLVKTLLIGFLVVGIGQNLIPTVPSTAVTAQPFQIVPRSPFFPPFLGPVQQGIPGFPFPGQPMNLALVPQPTLPSVAPQVAPRTRVTGLFPNPLGTSETLSITQLDDQGPFFHPLGTNSRSCVTCHNPEEGYSVTPAGLRARFEATQGLDPAFISREGTNDRGVVVRTLDERRQASSVLLTRAAFRVEIQLPTQTEFDVASVINPYSQTTAVGTSLEVFRRVLPSTNLRFLAPGQVTWDLRAAGPGTSLMLDLQSQAEGAILGHEAGTSASTTSARQAVAFETSIVSAMAVDSDGRDLTSNGANGGPGALLRQHFTPGENDFITGSNFNPIVFNSFDAWRNSSDPIERQVALGQDLLNNRTFSIVGVRGLNDVMGKQAVVTSCTGCHNAFNVGTNTAGHTFDIGSASAREADLPFFTLRDRFTGEEDQLSDPGQALTTGRWVDRGKFKVPGFLNLAARPPFGHAGQWATIEDAIEFHNTRFQINFTIAEKSAVAAFLKRR